MQNLVFEEAWDKTISNQDRYEIERAFQQSMIPQNELLCTPLWRAINHKGDLLVTVLIHNGTKEDFSILDKTITLLKENKILAKNIFSIPQLQLKPKTSMPWTLIFPKGTFDESYFDQNGRMKMTNTFITMEN